MDKKQIYRIAAILLIFGLFLLISGLKEYSGKKSSFPEPLPAPAPAGIPKKEKEQAPKGFVEPLPAPMPDEVKEYFKEGRK